jgi:Zn2+/Cd2+-exporting ATPase
MQSWTEALAAFLVAEEGVEAIRLNPSERTVSLATLGPVNAVLLQEKLSAVLSSLDEEWGRVAETSLKGGLQVKQQGNELLLEKPSCFTAPGFWLWREYEWPASDELEEESGEEWRALALQAAVCGVSLLLGWLIMHQSWGPAWLHWLLLGVSLVAGGWDAAVDAWPEMRRGTFDIHFLMLAVAAGAVSIGHWEEGALLLFLFSTSGALEHYVLHRTHREIHALTKAAPKIAHVLLASGETEDRPVQSLTVGERILVRPDELYPVDAVVIDGSSAADESAMTGEALPVQKEVGAEVYGGTLNLWGVVKLRVTKPATESALAKIITLIQKAQHLRAPSQRFTDAFGTRYTMAVLGAVAVAFLVWWLGLGLPAFHSTEGMRSAFYRAMTLLVVLSPCALVLSIPSAILAAIAWGARRGILFRGGSAIEKLAEVNVVAMDKTGTLTEGELKVEAVESFPPGVEQQVLQVALTMEVQSNHPIARAITAYGKSRGLEVNDISEYQSITGQGIRAKTAGGVSYVGRRELISQGALGQVLAEVPDAPVGHSEVWVLQGSVLGRILLRDEIRSGSKMVLAALHDENVRTIMLTGDRRAAAIEVAQKLGMQEVRAGLHPEDKVKAIHELTQSGLCVAMVGDGVNDAPSLAAADVSITMGARGSDAAMEQSDVVLMNDRIEKLLSARHISVRARAIIRQNMSISLGAVVIMAVATLSGRVPLTLGVLAHEGSTVLVCLNALRLIFAREPVLVPSPA